MGKKTYNVLRRAERYGKGGGRSLTLLINTKITLKESRGGEKNQGN